MFKVLVIGQPFNKVSGGGITISNLFSFLPNDLIFLATNTHRALKNDPEICKNVYLLGPKETKIPIIFRPFIRNFISGKIFYNVDVNSSIREINPSIISKKYSRIYRFLSWIVSKLDLNFLFFKIKPSKEFLQWVTEIKPDIIYTQLGHLEFIEFTRLLKLKIDTPLVVHIMDDWIENSATGIFKNFWQSKIKLSFLNLSNQIDLLMCISDEMSAEYQIKYKKEVISFHNPVDFNLFSNQCKPFSFNKEIDKFLICYTGRVGFSNENSILRMSDAIEILNKMGYNISFRIYTRDYLLIRKIIKSQFTEVLEPVNHEKIAQVFAQSHLLFLPLDFDTDSLKFTRLSFPSKASEYMVSKRPILLNAHKSLAITKHAIKFNWATIVDNDRLQCLVDSVEMIFNNYSSTEHLVENAYLFAEKNFNINTVASRFSKTLEQVIFKKNHVQQ